MSDALHFEENLKQYDYDKETGVITFSTCHCILVMTHDVSFVLPRRTQTSVDDVR